MNSKEIFIIAFGISTAFSILINIVNSPEIDDTGLEFMIGFFGSSMLIGAFIGAIVAGIHYTIRGRKSKNS